MTEFLAKPLGLLLKFVYDVLTAIGLDFKLLSAYSLAVILTTIIFKMILLPLTLKQMKSMREMQKVQPLLKEIQEKYKNDKETLQKKTVEIYQEHKINPMGGCLPLLIQFPIIIAYFSVMRDPVKYVFGSEAVFSAVGRGFLWIKDISLTANFVGEGIKNGMGLAEGVVNGIAMPFTIPFVGIAFPLLGIIAAVTTYLSTKVTQPGQSKNALPTNDPMAQQQKMMTLMMPVMILFFAFTMSAGLVLYWIIGNVFTIFQYIIMNRIQAQKEAV